MKEGTRFEELVPVDPEDFLPCPGERRDKYAHGMEEVDVPCGDVPCTDVPCKQSRKEGQMKLKITIDPPCDGERNIEIVAYTDTGQRCNTIYSKEGVGYTIQGDYACGFLDGALAAFGFPTDIEKQSIKDLMRIHKNKTIVLTYDRLYCNIEIKEANND